MAERDEEELRKIFPALSEEVAQAVAALFEVEMRVEPYEPAEGEPVYAIDHRGPIGNVRLLLWPSLARVDVHCGPHSWIAKQVVECEVIDGLEVIFRTASGGMLFAAVTGDVLMVSEGSA